MNKIKYEIAVGILFFIALGIIAYFTIIISDNLFKSREYYSLNIVFPNIEGLGRTNKVKINGVDSGIVEDVNLLENSDVLVTIKMYNKCLLYENYEIKIKNETALGGKYIGIYPGSEYKDNKHYPIVKNMSNLKGKSSGDIFGDITDLIAENRTGINKSIKNIEAITEKINSGNGTVGKLINENKVYDNADDLIKEARDTMEDSREQAPITSFIRALLSVF